MATADASTDIIFNNIIFRAMSNRQISHPQGALQYWGRRLQHLPDMLHRLGPRLSIKCVIFVGPMNIAITTDKREEAHGVYIDMIDARIRDYILLILYGLIIISSQPPLHVRQKNCIEFRFSFLFGIRRKYRNCREQGYTGDSLKCRESASTLARRIRISATYCTTSVQSM